MVAVTVGGTAADGICIDTPTPLSAKSTNKTSIQKGIFLIFHCLLSFKNGGFVHLIIGLIWLGLDNAVRFPLFKVFSLRPLRLCGELLLHITHELTMLVKSFFPKRT